MSKAIHSEHNKSENPDLVATPDGARTEIEDLNTGDALQSDAVDSAIPPRGIRRLWHNLNLVLAGMYTGLTCYGTPHEHHRYRQDSPDDADKPDRRPL